MQPRFLDLSLGVKRLEYRVLGGSLRALPLIKGSKGSNKTTFIVNTRECYGFSDI